MALAAEPEITDLSMHDERSAGFLAIGIARVTGRPVVVTCTSGTAAAEYHPAVVEASASRVPMIVLTADRPAELADVGAPQTVDQVRLYGSATRWSHDLEPPDASVGDRTITALGARLVTEATGPAPGPVHLNCRFREPLVPVGDPPAPTSVPEVHHAEPALGPDAARALRTVLAGRRVVVVCGPDDDPELPPAAAAAARSLDAPVLADPLSGLRAGPHDRSRILTTGDLLAAAGHLDRHPPDAVLRIGALPTSKPLWRWLEDHPEIPQVLVDPGGWRDPLASASLVVRSPAVAALGALADAEGGGQAWVESWRTADETARSAAEEILETSGHLSEPVVARTVSSVPPAGSHAWIASSMPIRDVDTFGVTRGDPLRYFGHRGANGIDGLLSAATGSAVVAPAAPTYALAGDLSTLHDLTAIAAAARLGADLTIVVVNNDGGGIFHYLPQIDHPEVFERHFGTPHGLAFAPVARALGAEAATVDDADDLAARLRERPHGVTVLEVHTDRAEERDLHRRVRRAVHAALDG